MHPKELSIKDFTYELPDERIARYPLTERDQSKLLIYRKGQIAESIYAELAEQLPANSLLVFNNTKVVEARLLFEKPNGGKIEIFCLEPAEQYGDITTAMLQKGKVLWKCLVGGAKKWKEGTLVLQIQKKDAPEVSLSARKVEQYADAYLIELSWDDPAMSFAELLHIAGVIPLPPYLNRAAEASDQERYQTIYAKYDGSVAAPTAGLHFTDHLFAKLAKKNIGHAFVTLHVGAGTFKPVKSETMQDHEMHAEFIDVAATFIEQLLQQITNPVIAVGTTSLRTLESLYWLGVKTKLEPAISAEALTITQWEPYELAQHNIPASEALRALLVWVQHTRSERLITKTQIIIAPGYTFRIIQGLITNFHQPQSTLLLLVAAITQDHWKNIYQYALDHEFRFLSYGDGSLLWL
jgi:S-adenosylmethionine:tRNA ribosyltransferase-isomerase